MVEFGVDSGIYLCKESASGTMYREGGEPSLEIFTDGNVVLSLNSEHGLLVLTGEGTLEELTLTITGTPPEHLQGEYSFEYNKGENTLKLKDLARM